MKHKNIRCNTSEPPCSQPEDLLLFCKLPIPTYPNITHASIIKRGNGKSIILVWEFPSHVSWPEDQYLPIHPPDIPRIFPGYSWEPGTPGPVVPPVTSARLGHAPPSLRWCRPDRLSPGRGDPRCGADPGTQAKNMKLVGKIYKYYNMMVYSTMDIVFV